MAEKKINQQIESDGKVRATYSMQKSHFTKNPHKADFSLEVESANLAAEVVESEHLEAMKQPRTNQENPDTANFTDLLHVAGLTEQEAAEASSLHINTVKKILRGDHVHPNSRLKLFRTLRPASDTTVLEYPKSVKREIPKVADYTPQARKHAVQQFAQKLSREIFELTLELVAGRVKLSEAEYSEMLGLIELARTTLLNSKPKK